MRQVVIYDGVPQRRYIMEEIPEGQPVPPEFGEVTFIHEPAPPEPARKKTLLRRLLPGLLILAFGLLIGIAGAYIYPSRIGLWEYSDRQAVELLWEWSDWAYGKGHLVEAGCQPLNKVRDFLDLWTCGYGWLQPPHPAVYVPAQQPCMDLLISAQNHMIHAAVETRADGVSTDIATTYATDPNLPFIDGEAEAAVDDTILAMQCLRGETDEKWPR